MKAKIVAVTFVAIMAVPAFAAAATYSDLGPKTEQVVEGHNVFAVIQAVVNRNITGVTVLVREQVISGGKLWFNDQYLIRPDQAVSGLNYQLSDCGFRTDGSYACSRYPCGGAVIATESGNPNPITSVTTKKNFGRTLEETTTGIPMIEDEYNINYVESYFITDPNDHSFYVDKYIVRLDLGDVSSSEDWDDVFDTNNDGEDTTTAVTDAEESPYHTDLTVAGETIHTGLVMDYPIWVVNILGAASFTADDGVTSCQAFIDNPPQGYFQPTNPLVNGGASYCYDGNTVGPDGCIYDGYARNTTYNVPSPEDGLVYHNYRRYNAEIVLYMKDLKVVQAAGKEHGVAGADASDTNGCESGAYTRYEDGSSSYKGTEWTCPNGDDDAEGNSHPFNPLDQGAGTPTHAHDTARLDLYYSGTYRPQEPSQRNFVIFDLEGSSAPFDLRH
ncbi:MAG TPA: hypothetical protein VM889_02995 [Candidatus Thermoplasmatota archaeon]|nr:hypothetical protein [Candidatus Thermoplasmatota archaeon]